MYTKFTLSILNNLPQLGLLRLVLSDFVCLCLIGQIMIRQLLMWPLLGNTDEISLWHVSRWTADCHLNVHLLRCRASKEQEKLILYTGQMIIQCNVQ